MSDCSFPFQYLQAQLTIASTLAILTFLSLVATTACAPRFKRSHHQEVNLDGEHAHRRHRHDHRSRPPRHHVFDDTMDPMYHSERVVFSANMPHTAPPGLETGTLENENSRDLARQALALDSRMHNDNNNDNETDSNSSGQGQGHQRAKRSHGHMDAYPELLPVCASEGVWTQLREAEDESGNMVRVLQEIEVSNIVVNQYFWQVSCVPRDTVSQCNGIDSSNYASMCREGKMYVYAKIQDRFGNRGWSHIKIGGSCQCALVRKNGRNFDFAHLFS